MISLLVFTFACTRISETVLPNGLRVEYHENPMAIDITNPRLSWKISSLVDQQKQTAYEILVSSTLEKLEEDEGDLWSSGRVRSDRTINIKYQGAPLGSHQQCYWKVRIWDKDSIKTNWSGPASWNMGIMEQSDWKASWIGYDQALTDSSFGIKTWANKSKRKGEYRPLPAPFLRTEFSINSKVKRAVLYITSLGIYEAHINGKKIGEDHFTPGWTDYRKRIYYNTYEVTDRMNKGLNCLGVILGDGWYAGNIADRGQRWYGDKLRLLSQLRIEYEDGEIENIVSGKNWKASYGPMLESDMQGGETYDARLEFPGWNMAKGFKDDTWASVVVDDTSISNLQAYPGNPVRQMMAFEPLLINRLSKDTVIVDMGQNFAGWLRVKLKGKKGDSIQMRFAEILNKDGSIHTRNLRSARCTDTYVFKGDSLETWEPRFTYHGFRFVEITKYNGELSRKNIKGVLLHSDLKRTGGFSTSNKLVNKLYFNILWSQRSNYFEIPTDCSQRDERMGWTGDAQVFMPTAFYNMDIAAFFNTWV
ncbi:MAG: family 78 glycoside hydrolase catalytic domain [Bacteroidetes bacterium]|nr:family 78 glycoside hydrolase catalytic domain [Bacteroidota bacterium]